MSSTQVVLGCLGGFLISILVFRSWCFLCKALLFGGTGGTVLAVTIALFYKVVAFFVSMIILWEMSADMQTVALGLGVFFVMLVFMSFRLAEQTKLGVIYQDNNATQASRALNVNPLNMNKASENSDERLKISRAEPSEA